MAGDPSAPKDNDRDDGVNAVPLLVSLALTAVLVVVAFATAGGRGAFDPDRPLPLANIFDPIGTQAAVVERLGWLIMSITGGIFLVVAGLLAFTVMRFRVKEAPADPPPQVYGSNAIELAWTVIPIILVVVMAMASVRTVWQLETRHPESEVLQVRVVGHQWWWELEYPKYGFTTANELHIPVSEVDQLRHTELHLQSADVVHSFWIPQLAGKVDLIPGKTNYLWIDSTQTGTFTGQCAEYCGTQHAQMLLRVIVHTQEDFERWVRAQQQPAVSDPAAAAGQDVFLNTACLNCHTVRGTIANGRFGPDLTHFMDRQTLAAGAGENTRENLREWIRHPDTLKPGVMMPAMKLAADQEELLVDYLMTLR